MHTPTFPHPVLSSFPVFVVAAFHFLSGSLHHILLKCAQLVPLWCLTILRLGCSVAGSKDGDRLTCTWPRLAQCDRQGTKPSGDSRGNQDFSFFYWGGTGGIKIQWGGGIQLIHTFWYFIWIYTNRANTSSEGSVLFFPIHHSTAYNSQIVHPLMTAFPHFFTYILEEADFRRASVLHWFDFWKQEPNPYEEGHDPGTRPRVQCPTKGPAIMTHLY